MKQNILLLGNGIDRAYNSHGISWNQLLDKMTTIDNLPKHKDLPFPLEVVLRTNDHVDEALKKYNKDLYSSADDQELRDVITNLLDIGFNEILTTNYDYAIEETSIYPRKITDKTLQKMIKRSNSLEHIENKYYLHTYNQIIHKGKEQRIWHIHGEARKPGSIIIGHYNYVNLVSRWREMIQKHQKYYKDFDHSSPVKSWLDSFIMGNVYILGLGMNFCELDLWWLINRKKRETQPHGKIIFYEPENSSDTAKYALLKSYNVEIRHLGFKIMPDDDDNEIMEEDLPELEKEKAEEKKFNNGIYKNFYLAAIEDIKKEMASDISK